MRKYQVDGVGCNFTFNKTFAKIIKDYSEYAVLIVTEEKFPHCFITYNGFGNGKNTGLVCFRKEIIENPSTLDLFDLLHEIGHIMSNNEQMAKCECEFYATQWAIDIARKYDVKITFDRFSRYQTGIIEIMEEEKNNGIRNVPHQSKLYLEVTPELFYKDKSDKDLKIKIIY